ncbi:STM4014 family protein [Flammeovirga sp. EKP202]|uniref:STM4014 family protein n=1 Tax=Flammeovirga sp. EKP202 TaxID=2770592 RepID=UPI00165FCD28|nr:STM4014 family protein [Flammeovirga sp. EKP202]MBD0400429.1 STM4014 family protein [Flammeovirga sp. EKP202]
MKVILIGNPENRRLQMMQEALHSYQLNYQTIAWIDLLSTPHSFESIVEENDIIKIDSFGENFDVFKGLLKWGSESIKKEEFHQISKEKIDSLPNDKGRIQYSRQAYLGFKEALKFVENCAMKKENVRFINTPTAILQMFDKKNAHQILLEHHVAKTKFLGTVRNYEELQQMMNQAKEHQVFIKLAHGSSSSGVMAYRRSKSREVLKTSVEIDKSSALYNSLNISTYRDATKIELIINQLAKEHLIVEKWEPKATFNNKVFDLRLVVIDQKVEHVVMRSSTSPMTNLHLGNERGDLNGLIDYLGNEKWEEIKQTAIQAVKSFQGAMVAGVDLMVQSNSHKVKIIEVNAFGDLVPRIVNSEGRTTYEEQAFIIKSIFDEVLT